MLAIKRTTLLPINCYYGISAFKKNNVVLISIPRYPVFLVYRPTLECGWATETKNIKSVPDPFGAGAYTAKDKALCKKTVWFMRLRSEV